MTRISTLARNPAMLLTGTSALFVVLYTTCNRLTGLRHDIGRGVFGWEQAIPFVPWTIVPYLSIIGFFVLSFFAGDPRTLQRHVARLLTDLGISLACYALFPLRFQFERPLPDGAFGTLFDLLGCCDLPYNRAPSSHISVLVLLWVRLAPRVTGWKRVALDGWFALIGVSVLTTYQHHVIDIPAGIAVAVASIVLTSPRAGALRARPAIVPAAA